MLTSAPGIGSESAWKPKVSIRIDCNDPRYGKAASEFPPGRHDQGKPEVNINRA